MASVTELLREVMTLTSNVQGLISQTERLEKKIYEHFERITKLEAREELTY